jgi:hypothetical protein
MSQINSIGIRSESLGLIYVVWFALAGGNVPQHTGH